EYGGFDCVFRVVWTGLLSIARPGPAHPHQSNHRIEAKLYYPPVSTIQAVFTWEIYRRTISFYIRLLHHNTSQQIPSLNINFVNVGA
ncbi:MAG: hypothetical protein P8L71_00410, partial [Flavobacteriales bacterium]|nr:hypothetical protein [Flavobacteriales bacterium]